MKELNRYEKYSRKDIHDIFSPDTIFTPQAGSWGLWGIIPVPNTLKDYVFIVTYGKSESGHKFQESIDEHGILSWQSQPQQTLNEKRILDFINHDHLNSNIYLFLRTSKNAKYSYLGKLAYVSHDNQREKPVYFKWQILDWDSEKGNKSLNINYTQNLKEIDIETLKPEDFKISLYDGQLEYYKIERKGKATKEFNNKNYDFEGEAKKNSKLGNKGEDLVIYIEKQHLLEHGKKELANKVKATRDMGSNSESYDILSYELDGTTKYIEVKTTTGSINNIFHISEPEIRFSEKFADNYYLYRLYNFNSKTLKVNYVILKGAINRNFLEATNYVGRINKKHLTEEKSIDLKGKI